MNRNNFNQKHQALVHSQQEMDRKWRCYLAEQEQMDLIEGRRGLIGSPLTSGAGEIQSDLPSNVVEFVVNTNTNLGFTLDLTTVGGESTSFIVNWGDGNIENFEDQAGNLTISHDYSEVGNYTVTMTFADPTKIFALDFIGDD